MTRPSNVNSAAVTTTTKTAPAQRGVRVPDSPDTLGTPDRARRVAATAAWDERRVDGMTGVLADRFITWRTDGQLVLLRGLDR